MERRCAVVSCLLLTVAAATAQTGGTQINERLLPQWLTGIIAVSVFLFLAFVTFLVNKAWCGRSSRSSTVEEPERENELVMTNGNTYSTTLDVVRSKEDMNAYDNLVIDSTDDRVTPM
ncbi:PDZK1-interacting protein 1 [Chelmon rostratus]|uniref:PDZK1-interacting protein 1 n=1 Tax=Chelmon rostratus TaxID=109905 RepID=UPI001BE9A33B|nr:PDZK1-interacting protein 1 [Chelmon rostratus]